MGRYNPNPSDPQQIQLQRTNATDLQTAARAALGALGGSRLVSAMALSGAGSGARFTLDIEHTDANDWVGLSPAQLALSLTLFTATSADAIDQSYAAALAEAQAAAPAVPLADYMLAGGSDGAIFMGAIALSVFQGLNPLPWPGSLACGPLLNGAVKETTPAGALYPTDEVWYTDAGKTQELLHTTYTRDGNQNVIQTVWQVYNLDGALVLTVTDVFTYVGSYVSTQTRTVS